MSKRDLEKFPAGRPIQSIFPQLLNKLHKVKKEERWRITDVWPKLVGEKYAPFTKVQKFDEGTLFVQVSSPALLNILTLQQKPRLLKELQEALPKLRIKSIVFRR